MQGSRDFFETGPETSLLSELARFYRGLGFFTEKAYARKNGVCGCGEDACARNPHFGSNSGNEAAMHLVMRADAVLATRHVGVLDRALRFGAAVPLLRHDDTTYLFVSDPEMFPNVFPVLGPPWEWISLPPRRSDSPAGNFALPSWVSPLTVPAKSLPCVAEVLGSSTVGRLEQLSLLAKSLPIATGEAVSQREIVHMAFDELSSEAAGVELLAFLSASWVAGMITREDALGWLARKSNLLPSGADLESELDKATVGVLFSAGEIGLGEVQELLARIALSLVDTEDSDPDEVGLPSADEWGPEDGGQERSLGDPPLRGQGTPSRGQRGHDPDGRQGQRGSEQEGGTRSDAGSKAGSPAIGGGSASNSAAGVQIAGINWGETLEHQEAQIFSAALALFTRAPEVESRNQLNREVLDVDGIGVETAPTGVEDDAQEPALSAELADDSKQADDSTGTPGTPELEDFELEEFERKFEIEVGHADFPRTGPVISELGIPGSDGSTGVSEGLEHELEEADFSEAAAADGGEIVLVGPGVAMPNAELFAEPLEQQLAEMARVAEGLQVRIDWERALSGVGGTLQPVSLVEALLGIPEITFSDDPLCTLALLDMAITAIPDGAEQPLTLLSYLWPDSEALISTFRAHLLIVQLLAGLLARFEHACSHGVLTGEASLASLVTTGSAAILSDLVADPATVFWIQRHLLSVTTPELLAIRIETVSKIVSAIGHSLIGDISTARFRALLGSAIDD